MDTRTRDRGFTILVAAMTLLFVIFVKFKGTISGVGMGMLFIASSALLFSERRELLAPLSATRLSRWIGASLLAVVLVAGYWFWHWELLNYFGHPERMLPLFTLYAALLIFYGVAATRIMWREHLVLLALGLPPLLLFSVAAHIAQITAKGAALLLWYLGFEVTLVDTVVYIPGGAVNVAIECSGYILDAWLLGISTVALVLLPLRSRVAILMVPVVAVAIGILTNIIRIAGLTLLSRQDNAAQFDYWHTHSGSQLFGLFGIGLFMLLYWALLTYQEREQQRVEKRRASRLEERLRQLDS